MFTNRSVVVVVVKRKIYRHQPPVVWVALVVRTGTKVSILVGLCTKAY